MDLAFRLGHFVMLDSKSQVPVIEHCFVVVVAVKVDAIHLASLTDLMHMINHPIVHIVMHMHVDRLHNYRLPQIILNQRLFDASIWFYKNRWEKNRKKLNYLQMPHKYKHKNKENCLKCLFRSIYDKVTLIVIYIKIE